MATNTRTDCAVLGYTDSFTVWGCKVADTKANQAGADTTRLDYADAGDVFISSCTDGVSILVLQSDGTLADS